MSGEEQEVTIDGKVFALDELSEEAIAEIRSLQFVESEIARLNSLLAVVGTAKIAYQNALKKLLPE